MNEKLIDEIGHLNSSNDVLKSLEGKKSLSYIRKVEQVYLVY